MKDHEQKPPLEVPEDVVSKWQNILDILSESIGVPAALIMRIVEPDIEVFVSSQSDGNPYHPGDHERLLGSGLYCERVIRTKQGLLVPNALTDEAWKDNPDVKLNMVSYCGFPLLLPDKTPFGTICVLDNKENAYSDTHKKLLGSFREVVESQLDLVYVNALLGEKHKRLSDYLAEIRVLRGIVPICSFCKKIRDAEGKWNEVEVYISGHSEARFSHGCCPECVERHYPDLPADS